MNQMQERNHFASNKTSWAWLPQVSRKPKSTKESSFFEFELRLQFSHFEFIVINCDENCFTMVAIVHHR